MKRAQYEVAEYIIPRGSRFIATAWNYAEGVLLSTRDYSTYSGARNELEVLAEEHGVWLADFNGHSRVFSDGSREPVE
jgi:hypothetical protein